MERYSIDKWQMKEYIIDKDKKISSYKKVLLVFIIIVLVDIYLPLPVITCISIGVNFFHYTLF